MIATIVLSLVIAGVLVPLIRRDLRRAASHRRARQWAARIDRQVLAAIEAMPPSEEFAREYLDWWIDGTGVDADVLLFVAQTLDMPLVPPTFQEWEDRR